MLKRLIAFAAVIALATSPVEAQIVYGAGTGGGGGGSGTVTNIATGAGLTGGPITTTGTIATTEVIDSQIGTSYTIQASDAAELVTFQNASPVAVTLPQATGSFAAGFAFTIQNKGAGLVTVTPTTSTINGNPTLPIAANTGCDVVSDGTNYQVAACTAIVPTGSGTVNTGAANAGACYATAGTAVSDCSAVTAVFNGINLQAGGSTPTNGLFLPSANTPAIYAGSAARMTFNSALNTTNAPVAGNNASSAVLQNTAASATSPTLAPNRAGSTTGLGAQAAGNMSLIAVAVEQERITSEGLLSIQTTAPAVGGTATPTIASGATDEAGEVTAGTTATSVTITFNKTHAAAPFCTVTSQTQLVAFAYTISNTVITITQTATSGNKIDYSCRFHA